VTVTSLPIITVSPTRLVKINIFYRLLDFAAIWFESSCISPVLNLRFFSVGDKSGILMRSPPDT
jgi:hypothetical protein